MLVATQSAPWSRFILQERRFCALSGQLIVAKILGEWALVEPFLQGVQVAVERTLYCRLTKPAFESFKTFQRPDRQTLFNAMIALGKTLAA